MGMVANLQEALGAIDLNFRKVRQTPAHQYRAFIWSVFTRILENTPQSTGRAVANWNIGINSPDLEFDPDVGDEVSVSGGFSSYRSKGDKTWIEYAKERNIAKVWGPGGGPRKGFVAGGLTGRDIVYITNMVEGDDDEGNGGVNYLLDLQDPAYAARRLRVQNQPYETAQESIIIVASKMLSKGFDLPKIAGGSWE